MPSRPTFVQYERGIAGVVLRAGGTKAFAVIHQHGRVNGGNDQVLVVRVKTRGLATARERPQIGCPPKRRRSSDTQTSTASGV
jgi:hypothetical protein